MVAQITASANAFLCLASIKSSYQVHPLQLDIDRFSQIALDFLPVEHHLNHTWYSVIDLVNKHKAVRSESVEYLEKYPQLASNCFWLQVGCVHDAALAIAMHHYSTGFRAFLLQYLKYVVDLVDMSPLMQRQLHWLRSLERMPTLNYCCPVSVKQSARDYVHYAGYSFLVVLSHWHLV